MPYKRSPCTKAGCSNPSAQGLSRCPTHKAATQRHTDTVRGTSAQRGYGTQHRQRFRAGVLTMQPYCVLCGEPATVADHYPLSRADLLLHGLDPDDPAYGRGLCKRCHDRHTARAQPGHRFHRD